MSDVVTPHEVEREIMRLSELCEHATQQVAQRAREAARADALFKKRYFQSLLVADGRTVTERQAMAHLSCSDEYEHHKFADAVLLAAQEAGRNYRAQLDALRSVNANVRVSAGLG